MKGISVSRSISRVNRPAGPWNVFSKLRSWVLFPVKEEQVILDIVKSCRDFTFMPMYQSPENICW